jgi:primosomal protein N' (replication factor Y)
MLPTNYGMTYLDVIVPGPWWNALTYIIDAKVVPPCGSRVRVPVKNSLRVGFVLGASNNERVDNNIEYKRIADILDDNSVFGDRLWNLALWMGHNFMCGPGEAIKVMSPSQLLKGYPVLSSKNTFNKFNKHREFCESECYFPYDSEREDFYINRLIELDHDETALVLFPECTVAKRFYDLLPSELKNCALLWGNKATKDFWQNWLDVRNGSIKYVIGSPSAVYAPLCNVSLVIVEDEANPAYVSVRYPYLPARSIAGKLAFISESELILGGRLPSAKTYFRKKIKCNILPEKDLLHFVDIKDGFCALVQGVEKTLPISKTLVSETKKCLNGNMMALWIFDRKGYAIEVLCENCGWGLLCPICGAVMTAKNDVLEGEIVLCCRRCLNRKKLPESCPVCHGSFFIGKKPGLEALKSIADAFCEQELKEVKSSKEKKLVVGTRKILSLCDKKNVGLIAWIDIDLEAHKTDYASRFHTFSMVWESLWRGIVKNGASCKINKNRRVIIQSRNPAKGWQIGLKSGWEYFWDKELTERAELEFPPYKILVEIEVSAKENEALVKLLEENGYMTMNSSSPHDGKRFIWLSASPLSALEKILSPRFSINKSKYGYPRVRIYVE